MKKILFYLLIVVILFIIFKIFFSLDTDTIINGFQSFSNLLLIWMYLLLAFWVWGQIFIIHSNVVYPLLFLILRSMYSNIQITIFIFSIFLLFFKQAYIPKELLIIYLTITNFFSIFKNSDNKEYMKASIKLIGLSIFMFIDIFSIESFNLTFKYIMENPNVNIFLLGLAFIKTLVHASFYAILFSCFYMAINDLFYKDEEITYSKVFLKFIINLLKY